jgi:hypothetical protein
VKQRPRSCLTRWCFQTDDLDTVAARLGLVPEARGRLRPDGVKLSWRAAGLADSLKESWLPFFVAWDDATQHPGLTPVTHRAPPLGIAWVELATDDPLRLARYTAGDDADVRVVDGAPGDAGVGIVQDKLDAEDTHTIALCQKHGVIEEGEPARLPSHFHPHACRVSLSRHCQAPETAPTSSAWSTALPGISPAPPSTACCTA